MKTFFLSLLAVALLSGCASPQKIMDAGERAAVVGAQLNDDALKAAEFMLCFGASVGSIRRRYGDPERAAVWRAMCNAQDVFLPLAESP